jgi:isoleucyl-tRNA synthetase
MSKSLGNVMEPREIFEKWGADMLRVWAVSQDFTADMRLSEAMMTQLGEAYRKIRNTFRFALSNLFDFDLSRDMLADADLWEFDAWMLRRTGELVRDCRKWYENFEFHRVYHALHNFCSVDLSAFYFDVLKDRLYTFAARNRGRRSAQTALYRIASALLRLIAPITVYSAEEVWKHFPRRPGDPVSVHITLFPGTEEFSGALDDSRAKNWERLLTVREEVLKSLEAARNAKTISAALEAKLVLHARGTAFELLKEYAASLPALFIVSQVEVQPVDDRGQPNGEGALQIEVRRADGAKCERCWNYSTHVSESAKYPTLCERCVAALDEIEGDSAVRTANS